MLKVYDLSIDYVINPSLTDNKGLRFSWKLGSDKKKVKQKSYRVQIKCENGFSFDSGVVESPNNVNVEFDELVLPTANEAMLKVSVTDNYDECANSEIIFATGITPDEWGDSEWIKPEEHIVGWAPYIRTKFVLGKVKKAVMYACGLGCAEYYINGKRTDDYYIDPPMTNYEREVFYRRFDVTELLAEGGNALCVLLGEGFYSQSRVWGIKGFYYGDVCVKIKLDITFEDGTQKTIVTNTDDWKYKYSPITVNNVYGGETYDCRLETEKFAEYDGSDKGWGSVVVDTTPKGELKPCKIPPIKAIRTLPSVSVKPVSGSNDGAWIFDVGENIAGTVEFHLTKSPRGAVYVFRYAETLNEQGGLDFRSTGAFATQCIQEDIYICRGDDGEEVYRPRFCYHGFRYVEMTGFHDVSQGYGTMPWVQIVTGVQLSTDLRPASKFKCSYESLEKLNNLMDNTFRSNYHGFPEDCPAREKCGWLGDAQVCCNWGILSYDMTAAYEKYLHDIRTTREVYGTWQMISPGKRGCGEATPLWGCAQIIIPYYLWKYKADKKAVIENADLMRDWVEHEVNRSEEYTISVGLGDWDPAGGGANNPKRMPVLHSSTFMFYEISVIMAELSREFGIGDEKYYLDLGEKIKESIIRKFYDKENHTFGYIGSDGVALELGTYPDGEKEALSEQLVQTIKSEDYLMPTGIYGNKYLIPALLNMGEGDLALHYLFGDNAPNFGRMIKEGATTIWEDPDTLAVMPRGTGVSSYNHPMHGGFLYSCYAHVAGLIPITPGYELFALKPCHTEKADNVEAVLGTPYGDIELKYSKTNSGYIYSLTVPTGSECKLEFNSPKAVLVDGNVFDGDFLGSGRYTIEVEY